MAFIDLACSNDSLRSADVTVLIYLGRDKEYVSTSQEIFDLALTRSERLVVGGLHELPYWD